jgi:hypothetical protein
VLPSLDTSTILIDHLVKNDWSGRLELAVEDYLHGLISVVNELVSCLPSNELQAHHPVVSTRDQFRDNGRVSGAPQDLHVR